MLNYLKGIWKLALVVSLLPITMQANTKTVYENAEDGRTTGWRVYDKTPAGAKIRNVYDSSKKSRVIELNGNRTSNGYILGGYYKNKASWKNKTQKQLTWSMKAKESYVVYISLDTKKGHRYLYYTSSTSSYGLRSKEYIHHGLGRTSVNNRWHTFTRDLEKDLKEYEKDNSIVAVEGFLVRGSINIDDISLSGANGLCKIDTLDNKIDNPCLEEPNNKWTAYVSKGGKLNATLSTDESHSGTHSLKVVNSAVQNSGFRYSSIPIDKKKTITFSGWNKAKNVGSNALNALDFKVTFADGTYTWFTKGLKFKKGTHDWEYLEHTETFAKEVVSIRPYVLLYYDKGTVWFDDIYVKAHKLSSVEKERRAKKVLGINGNLDELPEDLAKKSEKWKETFHVLNRFSYGANSALLDSVTNRGGIDKWFDEQLSNTTDVSKLAYRNNNNKAQMKLDNYFGTYQEMEYIYPVVRPMHSDRQLQAVMGTFWSNHFNTNRTYPFERVKAEDKFFTNALGNFRDLLEISAKSAAMSIYLDGYYNRKGQPNENYAREIMELHTLGISNYYNCEKEGSYNASNGYCLSDITDLARIFTGWSFAGDSKNRRYDLSVRYVQSYIKDLSEDDTRSNQAQYVGLYNRCLKIIDKSNDKYCYAEVNYYYKKFLFRSVNHDSGDKTFLGESYSADGQNEGERVLTKLARSPMTAKNICTKLAKKFVSDNPSKTTVSTCISTFMAYGDSDNQIAEVLRVLRNSYEFNNARHVKIKDTQEYLLSLARLMELDASKYKGNEVSNRAKGIGWMMRFAQQGFYAFSAPTGWSEDASVWGKSDRVLNNWRYGYVMLQNRLYGHESMIDFFKNKGITTARELIFYLLPIMTSGEYGMQDLTKAYSVLCNNAEECKLQDKKIRNLIEYLSKNAEFSVQ